MLSIADEIKNELAQIDAQIADAREKLEIKRAGVAALESFIDQKIARRWQVEARLQREEAQLVRPVGPCVRVESNGVEWKV